MLDLQDSKPPRNVPLNIPIPPCSSSTHNVNHNAHASVSLLLTSKIVPPSPSPTMHPKAPRLRNNSPFHSFLPYQTTHRHTAMIQPPSLPLFNIHNTLNLIQLHRHLSPSTSHQPKKPQTHT